MEETRYSIRRGDTTFGNIYANYHHGENRQKGTHHLHNSVNKLFISYQGRKIEIDKSKKPEGLTMIQWLCNDKGIRVGQKEAKRINSMFH